MVRATSISYDYMLDYVMTLTYIRFTVIDQFISILRTKYISPRTTDVPKMFPFKLLWINLNFIISVFS